MNNINTLEMSDKDAYCLSLKNNEPIMVSIDCYADDRGRSFMNLLQGVMSEEGQIAYSIMYPNVIKAWHRHRMQTDFWICVSGHLKAGASDGNKTWIAVMGEMHPCLLIMPPLMWHGAATIGDKPASLLYYVICCYDPQSPDEERMSFDAIEAFPWSVQCR